MALGVATTTTFQDLITKPTKDTQKNDLPIFLIETEFFPFEKHLSWLHSNQGPLPSQVYSLPSG